MDERHTLRGIVSGRRGAYLGSVRIGGVELRDATAASLMRAVARLRDAGKTIVLVSHRASTCAFADRLYSVERGRLS